MADRQQRRDFIKSVSLAGASLAVTDPNSAYKFLLQNTPNEIKNSWFTVLFDLYSGTININRNDAGALITNANICINLLSNSLASNSYKRFISSSGYKHSTVSTLFSDQIGPGKKLIIYSKDRDKKINFEVHVCLYDNIKAITIEAICKNVSDNDIVIHSIEPIRIIKSEGSTLKLASVSKCITNGEMYFDTGTIHEFGNNRDGISSGNLKGVKLANGPISSQSETIHSWWNAGLFGGYTNESLAMGYIGNNLCLGNLLICKSAADEISLLAESVYAPSLVLKPGKTISSNRLMMNLAGNPYTALENYADAVGKINNARTHSIINGWCSWFYTLSKVSEDEVIANTVFASEHLKPYGLEYIQIDEGYQRWHGDWEGNERFPHGMKWLAGKIKSYGLKAGLWISPYVIS